jgi:DNA-binding IscR family transcriptional regulator
MSNPEKVLSTLKLSGKPLVSSEIAAMSGIERKEVDKVLKVLKKEGKITSPVRCFYQISNES